MDWTIIFANIKICNTLKILFLLQNAKANPADVEKKQFPLVSNNYTDDLDLIPQVLAYWNG